MQGGVKGGQQEERPGDEAPALTCRVFMAGFSSESRTLPSPEDCELWGEGSSWGLGWPGGNRLEGLALRVLVTGPALSPAGQGSAASLPGSYLPHVGLLDGAVTRQQR